MNLGSKNITDLIKPSFVLQNTESEEQIQERLRVANDFMLKVIPRGLRFKVTYTPLMILDNSMRLFYNVRMVLVNSFIERSMHFERDEKDRANKKLTRDMKEVYDDYQKALRIDIDADTKHLDECSKAFYKVVEKSVYSLKQNFEAGLIKEFNGIEYSSVLDIASCCYLIKELANLKEEYEAELCEQMNVYLRGSEIQMTKTKTKWQMEIDSCIDRTLKSFNLPKTIKTPQLELCRLMIKNKIDSMDFELLSKEN